jgi:NAD-reducing hydrogenase small subunit
VKAKIATCSLAGCFGCHMSFMDLDERLLELAAIADLDRSPLTDLRQVGACDIGLVEGGVCNSENVEVLREFRKKCKILVAVGACAINGGIPALRNRYDLGECLQEAFLTGLGVTDPKVPSDPELPLLLAKVHPIHEVVKIDYAIPGCPPPAEVIWIVLEALLAGNIPKLPLELIRYD